MTKWRVVNREGVQAGIAEEGCNSPFVTLYYVDADTVVEKHNHEVAIEELQQRADDDGWSL